MSAAENEKRIDYVELPVADVAAAKRFYGEVFGWSFEDYGPGYASFHDGRLAGGFRQVDAGETVRPGGPEQRGSLLVASVGKGRYVYTGLALFRQLPGGVPGGYRLFANLLALR